MNPTGHNSEVLMGPRMGDQADLWLEKISDPPSSTDRIETKPVVRVLPLGIALILIRRAAGLAKLSSVKKGTPWAFGPVSAASFVIGNGGHQKGQLRKAARMPEAHGALPVLLSTKLPGL